jgi:hypothetical protein
MPQEISSVTPVEEPSTFLTQVTSSGYRRQPSSTGLEGIPVAQFPHDHQVGRYQYPLVAQPCARVPQEYDSAVQLYGRSALTSNAMAPGPSRQMHLPRHQDDQSLVHAPTFGLDFAQNDARFSLLDDDLDPRQPNQHEGGDLSPAVAVLPILSRNLFNTSNPPEARQSTVPQFGPSPLHPYAGTGARQTAHEAWMKSLWINGELTRMPKMTRTIDVDNLEGFFPNTEQRHQVRSRSSRLR